MTNLVPNGPDYEFQKLYFDTASATNAPAMAAILKLVPASHVMFAQIFHGGTPQTGSEDSRTSVWRKANFEPSSMKARFNCFLA